jgi:hypothetical protein
MCMCVLDYFLIKLNLFILFLENVVPLGRALIKKGNIKFS